MSRVTPDHAAHGPLFESQSHRCVELTRDQVSTLQRFFEANPEYFLAVNGTPPGPDEAREEFDHELPAGWPYERKWLLGFVRHDGSMIAMAGLVSDLFAVGVWHIGLLIVASSLHGSGMAHALYHQLESWMCGRGARWLRLGVVAGNLRAERFWERLGYIEVRKRYGVEMGERTNTLRVMAKPLRDGTVHEYYGLVARDRPQQRH